MADSIYPPEPRPDGCPECIYNVEEPRSSSRKGDEVTCYYECSDCGHRWFTGWKVA